MVLKKTDIWSTNNQ